MELEKINFCNSTVYKLNNAQIKSEVFKKLEQIYSLKLNKNYFPGPQPVAVEKKDIELLKREKYVVCEKSDGERYSLVLVPIDNKKMSFLINRNNDLLFIEIKSTAEMYEGTVFDGELIKNKSGIWTYLIHDCFAYNGTSYINYPHNKRYGAIIDFIVGQK